MMFVDSCVIKRYHLLDTDMLYSDKLAHMVGKLEAVAGGRNTAGKLRPTHALLLIIRH